MYQLPNMHTALLVSTGVLFFFPCKYPSQQTFVLRKTSFVFVFRIRLDQDQYVRLGHPSARRLLDVFITFSRCLQEVLPRRLAKTSSRRLRDVFKTSS